MADVLVIGLGGTGIKTMLHVKKQLLDQRPDGTLPGNVQLLGLDTMITPEKVKGISGTAAAVRRRVDMAYDGQVDLQLNDDYLSISGDTNPWVCGTNGSGWKNDHYARPWFDKDFFCNLPGGSGILKIANGAGQFRQVGRLALFFALRQGSSSPLYTTIARKLGNLGDDINLIVCGSLAGGTGASMWIDIAHLVSRIAGSMQKTTSAYAMLALPRAFQWTSPGLVTPSMKSRTSAALREMRRFLSVGDQDLGFEMRYSENNDPVLTSRTQGAVYKIAYLFETRSKLPGNTDPHNPLNVKIEYGVAPTMATWILALIDNQSGPALEIALANRENHLVHTLTPENHGIAPIICGTTGSYSVVLPTAALVEEWTIRLAQETLDELIPLTREGRANPAKFGGGGGAPAAFEKSDWEQHPVLIAKDGGKMGIDFQPGKSGPLVKTVLERKVNDWRSVFIMPLKDDESEDKKEEHQTIVSGFDNMSEENYYFYNEKSTGLFKDPLKGSQVGEVSARSQNNSAEAAAIELARLCDQEQQGKLAEWSNTVETCVDRQYETYRTWLQKYTNECLNGSQENVPLNAKILRAGKLGWLLKYISDCTSQLDNYRLLLEEAMAGRVFAIKPTQESIDAGHNGGLLQEIKRDARKQRDYLRARQQVLDYKRWELLCKAEYAAIKKFHAYNAYLRDSLQEFVTHLQGKQNSIRIDLETRLEQVKASRLGGKELDKVRELVNDPEWENTRYAAYTEADEKGLTAVMKTLHSFQWEVSDVELEKSTTRARNVPSLTLHVAGFPFKPNTVLAQDIIEISMDDKEDTNKQLMRASGNAQRIMARSRMLFEQVWDHLTVVDYLAYKWGGQVAGAGTKDFAEYLINKCDVLLNIPNDGQPLRWVYLMSPEVTKYADWRNGVQTALTKKTGAAQGWGGVMDHEDKTTLTYLVIADFINVHGLSAYKEGLVDYMKLPPQPVGQGGGRSLLHVFHAEEIAVNFDSQKPNGEADLVPPRVTAVLDADESFKRFILALALDLIVDKKLVEKSQALGNVKQVMLNPNPDEKDKKTGLILDKPIVWLLNNARNFVSDPVPYLVAAECFCLSILDHSTHKKTLQDMHTRLATTIDQKVTGLLQSTYGPMWKTGQGVSAGVAAYNQPPSEQRESELLENVRRELYRVLQKKLINYQKVVGMRDGVESEDGYIQMTKPDEIAFVDIMIRQIGVWLQQ